GRSWTFPELDERMQSEVLTRHGHVALVRLDEDAAVADLEDAALELADLHVVARCVVLACVVRADQVREMLTRAKREHECDAAEHGSGRDGGELDQEIDVDAELVDADHDAGEHEHRLREPSQETALAGA